MTDGVLKQRTHIFSSDIKSLATVSNYLDIFGILSCILKAFIELMS